VADCATLLDSSFTYQGQLVQEGVPLNGSADLEFTLWRTASGNEQIGAAWSARNVDVTNGLFTATIDFGIDAFAGSTRWLEVSVRSPHDPSDSQPYTTLQPRQLVGSAPYSLHSRGIVVDEDGRVSMGNISSFARLTVNNSIRIVDETGYGMNLSGGDQQGVFIWINPSGSNAVMRMDATGIGLYRVPQTNTLEVNGNASKLVAGSWLANSDGRIKTDVLPIVDAVATLMRVNPVSFRYTDEYRNDNPRLEDRRYLNVIAQEFAEVFPDAVQISNETMPDGSKILQVDTYPLTIYAAAAIRELHTRLAESERALTEQQRINEELRKRLDAIELRLAEIRK
jgi:hypothetical protein